MPSTTLCYNPPMPLGILAVLPAQEINRFFINLASWLRYQNLSHDARAHVLARGKQWRQNNKILCRKYKRAWKAANPDKYRAIHTNSKRRRLAADPQLKLSRRLRESIKKWFKSKNGTRGNVGKLINCIGYTCVELKTHLERQFLPSMSWDNYGAWHIDHIIPLAAFRFSSMDDPEFKAAWALSNLRPLWAQDNIKKGAKRTLLL